jgi:hypothetical protein
MSTRTVHDPFHGKDVQISDKLTDRLRGKYACGPMLPSGEPEFGWRQMPQIPIQVAAADRIDELEAALRRIIAAVDDPEGLSGEDTLMLIRERANESLEKR